MQQRFPGLTADDAWKKSQENASLLDVGSEAVHKLVGGFQQLAPIFAQAGNADQLHVDKFLEQALPGTSDAEKHAFLTELYKLPPEQRATIIEGYIASPQAGIAGQDPSAVATSLERLADPNYKVQRAAEMEKARALARQGASTDPRLVNTLGGDVASLGSLPEQLASYSIPLLGAARAADEAQEQVRQDHPDWSDEQIQNESAHLALIKYTSNTIANDAYGQRRWGAFKGRGRVPDSARTSPSRNQYLKQYGAFWRYCGR